MNIQEWEEVAGLPYVRANKPRFDAVVAEIAALGDYRSYMVKTSRKSELPTIIAEVARRTRLLEAEKAERVAAKVKAEQESQARAELMAHRQKLLSSIKNWEDFPAREKECLVGLIESGHVTEADFASYGIER